MILNKRPDRLHDSGNDETKSFQADHARKDPYGPWSSPLDAWGIGGFFIVRDSHIHQSIDDLHTPSEWALLASTAAPVRRYRHVSM